ncbi:MAG: hypothetical protein WAO71_04010 [Gallionella sp.]
MQDERYNPVPHDAAFVAELLADPATKQAYDALMKKYAKKRANLSHLRIVGWIILAHPPEFKNKMVDALALIHPTFPTRGNALTG